MANPKKIINDPKQVVPELLDGLIYAYHGQIHKIDGLPALIKTDIPDNKVALLIGGGSGHEPVFHGFIGPNMADGAACGNIFAAPSPDVILAATQAVHRGKGVLYVYGNYAGDNMNFDIAAEMAEDDGIAIRTVRIWDDVASAPPERCDERRGIAGDALVLKVAGAATAKAATFDEDYRITAKACDTTRSMAVAVASPGPGAAAGDFYERARETVRRMVAEEPTAASNGAPTGFDAPRLPALAEALAAPRAAESTTAGGRRRVVTRSGSEYCLAPRPDVPSGGLVPRLAVPTTCP